MAASIPPPSAPDSATSPATPRRAAWLGAWWTLPALIFVLGVPFLLKPEEADTAAHYDRRLVILSPHNERIRQEVGHAFTTDWLARTGERVYLDWRIPGGSSEIALFLKSEFAGAFRHYWETALHQTWTHETAMVFAELGSGHAVVPRQAFLSSPVGIGVDLLFGGGSYDFHQQAEAGYLVAGSAAEGTGPAGLLARHSDWAGSGVIPEAVSGEPFRDPENRWIGVVLATFGIVYNRDVLTRLGIVGEPEQWTDLADPRLLGQVALADPTKSGSVAKAFELMIQQQMQQAVDRRLRAGAGPALAEAEGIREGWLEGLRLIQRLSANARYFTDSAAKIPLEVARGDAAAGMAIDTYGRATQEYVRQPDGRSRVGFVAPLGGTSVSVDPIALLRGAPDPRLATAFIEFVISPRGQTLWAFRPGTPGGPLKTPLRRLPVRKDFYTTVNRRYMTDPEDRPYVQAQSFVYHPSWTGPAFGAIRFLTRVLCVDTHREQRRAWAAIVRQGLPARALAVFHDLEGLGHEAVLARIVPILHARDKVAEVRLARELGIRFRDQYRRAGQLAAGRGTAP